MTTLLPCQDNALDGLLCPHTGLLRHQILRTIFEHSPAFLALRSGPDHVYTYCNPAYRRLVADTDVIGRPTREVMAEIYEASYVDLLDTVYTTGVSFQDTVRVRARRHPGDPGQEHVLRILHLPIRDEHGRVVEILSHGIDITETVQTQEALQQSESKFRSLVEQSLIGIAIVQDDRLVYANPCLAAMVGVGMEELTNGVSLLDLLREEDRARVARHVRQQLFGEGREVQFRFRLRHRAGHLVYVEGHSSPFVHEGRPALLASVRDVSDRVQAEAALRESEARYSSLFLNNHAVMLVIDPVTAEIVDANPAACRYYGYTREELLRHRISDINVLSRAEVFEEMARARAEERTYFHFRHRLASGEIRNVEVASGPVEVYGRNLLYSIIHDTTERHRAEEKLKAQEQLLRLLAEHAQDLIFRYRLMPEPGFEYVSPSAASLLGHPPDAFYADPLLVRTLLHPDDLPVVTAYLAQPVRMTLNLRLWKADGALLYTEQQLTPILDEDGRLVALEGIARDVTARMEAQAELTLRLAALEAAANGIMVTRADGTIIWVNPAMTALTGYSKAELIGQNPRLLNSGRQGDGFYQQLHQTMRSGHVWHGTLFNRRKTGDVYVEDMTITPVRSTGGAIDYFVAIKQDVTRQAAYEQGLVEAKERAEEMVRLKNALLANMSHEIRTPLNAILGLSEFLVDMAPDEMKEVAQMINQGGERLLATLTSVLDLAQLQAGTMHLQTEPVAVLEEAEIAMSLFRQQALAKGLHVEVRGVPVEAELDRALLSRILNNLISNAVKFTRSGWIRVEVRPDAADVVLSVADSGKGIAAWFLPHVFEEFRQESDGLNRTHEGNGLGLAIVKRLVTMQGGTIHVESQLGRGAKFTVRMPLRQPTPAPA